MAENFDPANQNAFPPAGEKPLPEEQNQPQVGTGFPSQVNVPSQTQPTPTAGENLSQSQPSQTESAPGQVYFDSSPNKVVEEKAEETGKENNKGQKTLLFLALALFLIALLGLVFYFLNSSNLSKNKKTVNEVTPSPSLSVSPSPSSQKEAGNWIVYKAANFEASYPTPVVVKEGEDGSLSFFESADKDIAFLELKIFKSSENQTVTSVIEGGLKEVGAEFDSRNLKNILTPAQIGSYAGVSYAVKKGEETVEVIAFESADKNFIGRVLSYPMNLNEANRINLAEGILETFKFSGEESPTPLSSPLSSPVSSSTPRFQMGE